jgi:hypothetical protein
VVNPNGDNAEDLRVSTLAKPNRWRDAIGSHQRDPGRPALHLAHDQLPFMEGDNATARAGELGPIKQHQITMEEANPTHGITHHDQVLSAHWGRHKLTVQVDAELGVVVGRTGKFAGGHTRKPDLTE